MGISDVKTGGFWSGCDGLFRPVVFQVQCGQNTVNGGFIYLDRSIFALQASGKRAASPLWSLLGRREGDNKMRRVDQLICERKGMLSKED